MEACVWSPERCCKVGLVGSQHAGLTPVAISTPHVWVFSARGMLHWYDTCTPAANGTRAVSLPLNHTGKHARPNRCKSDEGPEIYFNKSVLR